MGKKQSKQENPQPLEESVAMNPERSEKGQLEVEEGRTSNQTKVSRSQGISREELIRTGNTTTWKVIRNILFIAMILSWVAMAAAAVYIIVTVPRCPDLAWWERNSVYQVYCRSYQDSGNDGIGDLKGIESRLEHLEEIGAKTLLLSNILQSNDEDLLFAVTDYMKIDSQLGSLDDLKDVLEIASTKDVNVVLDFIPNHSSEDHPWFKNSRAGNGTKYTDYYIWADGQSNLTAPNNWLNVFGDPAWTYEPMRNQWYYHTYTSKQPDLNLRNEDVQDQIKDALAFWLHVGVHGFLIKDASYLVEAEDLGDEPVNPDYDGSTDEYNRLHHTKTMNQPESYDMIAIFKKLVNDISTPGRTRTMMAEAKGPLKAVVGYYGESKGSGADVLYNYQFLEHLEGDLSGTNINTLIDEWEFATQNASGIAIGTTSWVLSDMYNERVASRYGQKYVQALNALIFTLNGVPFTYYGQEIGMESSDVETDGLGVYDPAQPQGNNTVPVNRIGQITPMQWTAEANAGFSNTSNTWLPINPNFETINVEVQKDDATSVLSTYAQMAKLRDSSPSMLAGKPRDILTTDAIYAFRRQYPDWPGYFIAINLSDEDVTEDYNALDSSLPAGGTLIFSSRGDGEGTVKFNNLVIRPAETIIVQF